MSSQLNYGISKRSDGTMKLADPGGNSQTFKNRKKYFLKNKIKLNTVVSAKSVHGSKIKIVNSNFAGKTINGADGLITYEKNIFLAITVADCPPVYLYEPAEETVGLIHAGWRGIKNGIIEKAVKILKHDLGIKPSKLKVYIGPHIRVCHYEVSPDFKFFDRYKKAVIFKNNKKYVDLGKIIKIKFLSLGLKEKNITISRQCTHELKNKFFSFRRDGAKPLRTMMAYIGIRD